MIEAARRNGVNASAVLDALARVPREPFVLPAFRARAYEDTALPIICGQTISQPSTVGLMTQLLELEPGMKVLEVGTGSGYQAAVLAAMGARVFTIERHAELFAQARTVIASLGLNVAFHRGDGSIGWSAYAPYDRIIVTAGAPDVPPQLLAQLAVGGRMVIPVGGRERQRMHVVLRDSEGCNVYDHGEFAFVPLIGHTGWASPEGSRTAQER